MVDRGVPQCASSQRHAWRLDDAQPHIATDARKRARLNVNVRGHTMGDVNQLTYLKRFMPSVTGPIVEIGSKDYGSTSSFRDFYAGCEYVGIDMEPGKNATSSST